MREISQNQCLRMDGFKIFQHLKLRGMNNNVILVVGYMKDNIIILQDGI